MARSPQPKPTLAAPALRRRAWLGGLLGALAALVWQAPAQWLAAPLWQLSQQHIGLSQPRGTLWTGSAQLLLAGGPGSQDRSLLPGRLHWQLRLQGLGLQLHLEADCCTEAPLEARLGWTPSGWQLQLADHRSLWPAAVLAGLGTPWNTLQFEGQLQLQTQDLQLHWADTRLQQSGQAELLAQRLASRLSTLNPMGSYRLRLHSAAGLPVLDLATQEGALRLSGQGEWAGGHLRFRGEASAEPASEAALSNLLNIIGRRQGSRSIMTLG